MFEYGDALFWQFQTQNPLLELPKTSLPSQIDRLIESGHAVSPLGAVGVSEVPAALASFVAVGHAAPLSKANGFSARSAISLIVFFSKARLVVSSASRRIFWRLNVLNCNLSVESQVNC